ncbi:MAG: DEAD/DEAH box helicase [Thermodesulfobacteriota bacterium]
MIRITQESDRIIVSADVNDLAPRHESQLAFWGFTFEQASNRFICESVDDGELNSKLIAYLKRMGLSYALDANIEASLVTRENATRTLNDAIVKGKHLKDGNLDDKLISDFILFLEHGVARPLKDHQYKAALHLLCTENGANFSVPGSGKTAVVLAVFHYLRKLQKIDSLFVVGPPACFGPWRYEYQAVLGVEPVFQILAGGDVSTRRNEYFVNTESVCDLYLTTFQTLQRDWKQVRVLFKQQDIRFFLVIDEAHYIKQIDGAWANAVLNIARHAEHRCVLTGTPFPRSYGDGFNLFDALWPESPPISSESRHRIALYTQQNQLERAAEILETAIGPLFYRVRKVNLGLAPQVFHEPLSIRMNKYERLVYDSILDRIRDFSQSDYFRNLDLLLQLRRGRMVRLRQCLSYTSLLAAAVKEYTEDLIGEDLSLSDVIKNYNEIETPAKVEKLLPMVRDIIAKSQKVVIWSNFVRTLEHLRDLISASGIGVRLIYGATPIQKADINDEMTREEIIREFVDPTSNVSVLIANPAACAESISLHKTCSHAIYYDLSYNCAQYIQSLDRIHRVGGSENKPSHYHFLLYADTIDGDILNNLQRKAENMSRVIDQDYPIYSLDMFEEDDELEAYERLFGSANKRV